MRFIFATFLLSLVACGDDGTPSKTVLAPLVIASDTGSVTAFGRFDHEWKWMTRSGADQTIQQPLWDELTDNLRFRGQGAPYFSAKTPANLNFRGWSSGIEFPARMAGGQEFDASTPATVYFDATVGFPPTCALDGICDYVRMACEADNDCDSADVLGCYAAVASGDVPPELLAYSCVISEYFSCVYDARGAEQVYEGCARSLRASGVVVEF